MSSEDKLSQKRNLLTEWPVYKPFKYPWAYEAWLAQQRMHWLPEEIQLAEDVKDWAYKLDKNEQNLLTQIFRFFTQADVEVNNCYMRQYSQVFMPTEIQMMMASFANMETVHIAAYAHLLDTIGMPEIEYTAFLKYKEMKDKYDYMHQWGCDTKLGIAQTLAVFGAFTEGLQLFASFAMLMNFPRFNRMKGMGQIVTYSARDETLHMLSCIRLFHTFLDEFGHEIDMPKLQDTLYQACEKIVNIEDAFIDLSFEMGGVKGMEAADIKRFIRFIGDRRLTQLGLKPIFKQDETNPLPWFEELLNMPELANFFENRATEYTRGATQGDWDDAFN